MISAAPYTREIERIDNLYSYQMLDTAAERELDELTALAASICDTPMALITLIDEKRQWFKSKYGLAVDETIVEYAFCTHAFHEDSDFMMMEDTSLDERFHDNPLVIGEPYAAFYAGAVLKGENGLPLGTLCVVDQKTRKLNDFQIKSLKILANQVMNLLDYKRTERLQLKLQRALEIKNEELSRFAYVAAHDLKSPLLNISALVKHLENDYAHLMDANGRQMLKFVHDSTERLRRLIDGLLQFSRYDQLSISEKEEINIENFCNTLFTVLGVEDELLFTLDSELETLQINPTVMDQILINLISNSIKYSDKAQVEIELKVSDSNSHYHFEFSDNGPGIAPQYFEDIFKIFEVKILKDKYGKRGNGIGLASVKKIVEKCNGTIHVASDLGKGARFIFSIEK